MSYPARVHGELSPQLSRWLWLVKWLLAIPHYFVLAFLWLAFFGVSVIAFFAVLLTTRYPRSLFDFNVGVLRWTWRVAFYSYGALGTDRYPPFTLAEVPDYPATFDVEYPEQLSRGLVLVKWWLLAIPHYLLVGIFVGSTTVAWDGWGGWSWWFAANAGLVGILVLVAAVVLLFKGAYPQSIFDLVLGLDRWVLRVAAYAGLMTDRYPPFRLDQGPDEPRAEPGEVAVAAAMEAPAPALARRSRWTFGRVTLVVLGSIVSLVGASLIAAGVTGVVVDQTRRDDQGYLMSPSEKFESAGFAVLSESAEVNLVGAERAVDFFLGTVKVESKAIRPVFTGIGPEADVNAYLDEVERSVVTELGRRPHYDEQPGREPVSPPGDQTFWVASSSGAGTQSFTWEPKDGDWVFVLMNDDGSAGVQADLSIGAEVDPLLWIGIGTLIGGLVVLLLGALAIAVGATRASRGAEA